MTAYLVLAAICLALAAAALCLFCGRLAVQARSGAPLEGSLPLLLRLSRGPAMLVAPLVSGLQPERMRQALARNLDSLGLMPQFSPELWFSMRVAHAMMFAALVLLCAGADSWVVATLAGMTGFALGGLWLSRMQNQRAQQIVRELPAYLDLLTVCVEAGATLTAGVRLIVTQAPDSPLRSYFDRVLREVRGGRPRALAFAHIAQLYQVECLTTLASALAHAEGSGMSLGQILRTQSGQRTAERFARAERLAMQAPVKMLGPLIFCIFPCTFIVLAVPIVVRMQEAFRA
jgi:tight adherence protein C